MADYLDATGLHIDSLEERIDAVCALLRALIAPNLDLSADQPSGQLVRIICERTQNALELVREVGSAWDPDNAQGAFLTALALITGTQRRAATYGVVELTVNLDGGVTLPAGSVASVAGEPTNRWVTDVDVVAPGGPPANYIVMATCEATGPVQALAGTITVIATPVVGWNTVTNVADATEGLAEETDTELRVRRELELALGGSTTVDAIRADLLELDGMLEAHVYENDLDVAVSGIAPHAIQVIIYDGGAVANADIAEAIFLAKAAGINTTGYTTVAHTDTQGNSHQIRFTRATEVRISVAVTIPAANRTDEYVSDLYVKQQIEAWAADFFTVGLDVYRSEITGCVVVLPGVENVSLVQLAIWPAAVASVDIAIAIDEIATIDVADITIL